MSNHPVTQHIHDVRVGCTAKRGGRRQNEAATDVWGCIVGVLESGLRGEGFIFQAQPDKNRYPRIGCIFCNLTWSNYKGCNTRIREHLKRSHGPEYQREVDSRQLKQNTAANREEKLGRQLQIQSHRTEYQHEIVSRQLKQDITADPEEEFGRQLNLCVVAHPCLLDIIDSPKFRKLLLCAGEKNIGRELIPSKALIEENILHEASLCFEKLKQELANSLGRISFTFGVWEDIRYPDNDYFGFLAVTAHWFSGTSDSRPDIRSELVSLQRLGLRGKDGFYTDVDNETTRILESLGPDVIRNIGLCTAYSLLDTLKRTSDLLQVEPYATVRQIRWCSNQKASEWNNTIIRGLHDHSTVNTSRNVHIVRERRLEDVIKKLRRLVSSYKCNYQEEWLSKLESLLEQDVSRHWGSMLFLIQQILNNKTILSSQGGYHLAADHSHLSEDDWEFLQEVLALLNHLRQVLEQMDVGTCGRLSLQNSSLTRLKEKLDKEQTVKSQIDSCIKDLIPNDCDLLQNLKKRYFKFHHELLLPMVIDPTVKFSQFNKNAKKYCKSIFTDLMLTKLQSFGIEAEGSSQSEHSKKQTPDKDQELVVQELSDYESAGLEQNCPNFDLTSFWKAKKNVYPHLYAVALDIIPFQCFAVSVERIFSTSAEIHALSEGKMSFQTFEALQRLKFSASSGSVDIREIAWGNLDTVEALKGVPTKAPDFLRLWTDLRDRESEDKSTSASNSSKVE